MGKVLFTSDNHRSRVPWSHPIAQAGVKYSMANVLSQVFNFFSSDRVAQSYASSAPDLVPSEAAQAPQDPNWAFSKEAIEVFKNKAGYTTIKSIELENPATGIWKAEGVKKIDGVEVEVETTIDHTGKILSEKKD